MKGEIETDSLRGFCKWFLKAHGEQAANSVFTTCICGYFHTYTKAAEALLSEMKQLGFVKFGRGTVRVIPENT